MAKRKVFLCFPDKIQLIVMKTVNEQYEMSWWFRAEPRPVKRSVHSAEILFRELLESNVGN